MKRSITILCAGALALAACSGEGLDDVASELENATDATVSDEVEQDAIDLAADVEQQMDTLSQEVQSSDAAANLQDAWTGIQTAVTEAIASMQADGTVATEGIEDALNEFQSELDAAGEEITPELRAAWESLKTSIQNLVN